MNLNYLKNLIIDTVQQNTQKVGIVSAIIILYFNPALYFTILSVGATVGLYQNFTYDLNLDFKMRKNLIEDKNDIGTNTIVVEEIDNKKINDDTVQTDTETEPEYDMTKSILFE
jgi:hypothetical protein